MARRPREIRDGKLFCKAHHDWAPIAQFSPVGENHWQSNCKLCRQTDRVNAKHTDDLALAREIVERRADSLAEDIRNSGLADFSRHQILCADIAGCDRCRGRQFCWTLLIPLVAAFLREHCCSCTKEFDGRSDVQLDHIHGRKPLTDFYLHAARLMRILCGSCNNSKKDRDDLEWGRGEFEKQEAYYLRILADRTNHIYPCGCDESSICLFCGPSRGF